MHKYILSMLLALALTFACVPKRAQRAAQSQDMAEELVFSSAVPPQGMRLGQSYVSALGESCFEAYPEYGASSQPQAFCHRAGGWELLGNIFMTVPHQSSAAASQ